MSDATSLRVLECQEGNDLNKRSKVDSFPLVHWEGLAHCCCNETLRPKARIDSGLLCQRDKKLPQQRGSSASRELREHIFSHKHEAQRGQGRKGGKAKERD